MALSAKNAALSPSVSDLGLGDQLNQQLQDQEAERKKKLLSAGKALMGGMAVPGAAGSLFPSGY